MWCNPTLVIYVFSFLKQRKYYPLIIFALSFQRVIEVFLLVGIQALLIRVHNYIKYLFYSIYHKVRLSCFLICCQIPQMNFPFYLQFLTSFCILFPFKVVTIYPDLSWSVDWSILYFQISSKFPFAFHFYGFAICLDSCSKSLAISQNQKWSDFYQ